jgi:hypothetical protein
MQEQHHRATEGSQIPTRMHLVPFSGVPLVLPKRVSSINLCKDILHQMNHFDIKVRGH